MDLQVPDDVESNSGIRRGRTRPCVNSRHETGVDVSVNLFTYLPPTWFPDLHSLTSFHFLPRCNTAFTLASFCTRSLGTSHPAYSLSLIALNFLFARLQPKDTMFRHQDPEFGANLGFELVDLSIANEGTRSHRPDHAPRPNQDDPQNGNGTQGGAQDNPQLVSFADMGHMPPAGSPVPLLPRVRASQLPDAGSPLAIML